MDKNRITYKNIASWPFNLWGGRVFRQSDDSQFREEQEEVGPDEGLRPQRSQILPGLRKRLPLRRLRVRKILEKLLRQSAPGSKNQSCLFVCSVYLSHSIEELILKRSRGLTTSFSP